MMSSRAPYLPRKMTSSKLPDSESWIGGILLSVWDNVAGPRIEHSWMGPIEPPPPNEDEEAAEKRLYATEQMHQMIARDTLAGTLEESLVVKLVVQPHTDGNVVVSVAFSAPYLSSDHSKMPTKFSMALFAKRSHVARITSMYRIVEDRLMYLALCARVVYTRCSESTDAIDRLSKEWSPASLACSHCFLAIRSLCWISFSFIMNGGSVTNRFIFLLRYLGTLPSTPISSSFGSAGCSC